MVCYFFQPYFKLVPDNWTIVDGVRHRRDQFNYFLSHVVTRRCLPTKYNGSWHQMTRWICLDPIVERNHVQSAQQLTLVLMNVFPLNMNYKYISTMTYVNTVHANPIDSNAVLFQIIFGQTVLIIALHTGDDGLTKPRVLGGDYLKTCIYSKQCLHIPA